MGKINWNDGNLRLDIPAMDQEHRELFEILDTFLERVDAGAPQGELTPMLDRLIEKSRAHFTAEEVLMDRHGFPDLAAHKAEHERLLAEAAHLQELYRKGEVSSGRTQETSEFIRRWLFGHIAEKDLPYRPFVRRLT
jgi:hemerythrin